MLNSSHENRARYYSKLSNELKSLFNKIVNNRNIKKKTDLKKILDHLDKLLWNIKYKRKSHYIAHDDDHHYGLKDLEKIFGDIDDYYKPVLATQSFYHKNPSTLNHQEYVCRETRESSQSIDDYLDKVQPHLVQLSKEKPVNELKIQLNLGVRLINEKDKKEFVYHVQTDNLKVLVTNEEIIVLYELFHNFKNKYQEGVNNIGQGSGYSYNGTEDLSINFRKIDLNRGASYIQTPRWLRSKGATINPQNENDTLCFSYAIAISLFHEELGAHPERINDHLRDKVKRLNWQNIDFPASTQDFHTFEKNNEDIASSVFSIA